MWWPVVMMAGQPHPKCHAWVVTLRCPERDRRVWWHPEDGLVQPYPGG